MIFPIEDRWGILSILEYEYGSREALLSLWGKKELDFTLVAPEQHETFLKETASAYATRGFAQGKELFRHAEASSWLTKPLLLYYGMLSVVKSGLVFRFPDYFLDPKNLGHGIGAGARVKTDINFEKEYVTIQKDGLYPLARQALGQDTFPSGTRITLHNILTTLPDADASYRLVCGKQGEPINYLKLWGNLVYRDPTDQRVRVGFHLTQALMDSVSSRLPAEITENFDVQRAKEPTAIRYEFRSKQTWENEAEAAFARLPEAITTTLDQNFAMILPIEVEGKMYSVGELELMYLMTFYLSSLARYQPHLWMRMHSGAHDLTVLLCQDILRSSENKFLDLVQRKLRYAGLLPFAAAGQSSEPKDTAPGPAQARVE
jgi:hypothetical protein